MNHKKIISNQDTRIKILKFLKFIPDEIMLRIQYRLSTGLKLDLKNPKRYTEKIQWYKLYYRNELLHQCVDKYNVRAYVKSKGLESILTEVYGVYKDTKTFNLDRLPNQFVLKSTNGSGGQNVILCRNKNIFDVTESIEIITDWLEQEVSAATYGKEYAYYGLKPKVMAEELLIDHKAPNEDVKDYKFLCFNGKVKYIWVDSNRYTKHTRNFYDTEWNYLDVSCDYPNGGDTIPKPKNLKKMMKIAEILSEEFPHVRVDLYDVNDQVYFGELTFYPNSGYRKFTPDDFDFKLGSYFNISNIR